MPKHSPDRRFTSFTRNLPPSKSRILRRNLMFVGITLTVIACLSLISKANAAGGPYVVDDGAINPPGECNVDLWNKSVRHDASSSDLVLSPACTFKALPMVQLGAAIEYNRDDGESETQLSPQLKAQLWNREDLGLQLAAAASTHFVINRAHSFDGADLTLPLTFTPFQALRLNFNAGWTQAYDNGEQNHRWTWGTGVEYDLIDSLTLVAERFGQQGAQQAWQAGPRLHIGERIDVDIVVGRNLTEDRDQWLTTGVTLRY
ncbi:hypothetical protein ACIPIN_19995 [Pseudomonas sp. NPDC087697]|uniref:hypothetical protein n=1 Tax=Pseudomonas sp. NPDC087697 TaxID=3364447 RepID=UPI00382EF8B4